MPTGAWYRYPEPDGRSYSLAELHDPAIVEEVFDYCQICLAIIHADGWRELFRVHGRDGLLAINRRSGWFDDADDDDAFDWLIHHARLSGYDPESDAFGVYDAETGVFRRTGRAPT